MGIVLVSATSTSSSTVVVDPMLPLLVKGSACGPADSGVPSREGRSSPAAVGVLSAVCNFRTVGEVKGSSSPKPGVGRGVVRSMVHGTDEIASAMLSRRPWGI